MKSAIKQLVKDSTADRLEKLEYRINSIAYLREDSSRKSPRTVMSGFKVLVMLSGQAEIFIGRAVYRCKTGDCVMFAPGSLYHAEISGSEKCSFVSLNFTMPRAGGENRLKHLLGIKDIAIFPDLISTNTMQYVEMVYTAAAEEREGSYHSAVLLLRRLIGQMVYTGQLIPENSSQSITLAEEQLVLKCHSYIINNPEQPVTVGELCRLCNVSQSYMYKSFRAVTGLSTKEFVTRTKLDICARELVLSDKTASRIATENGYSNGYRFSAAFKKQYGVSPSVYRRENR